MLPQTSNKPGNLGRLSKSLSLPSSMAMPTSSYAINSGMTLVDTGSRNKGELVGVDQHQR
jgi:hypothetical protein